MTSSRIAASVAVGRTTLSGLLRSTSRRGVPMPPPARNLPHAVVPIAVRPPRWDPLENDVHPFAPRTR
jgi:hypothetical protein